LERINAALKDPGFVPAFVPPWEDGDYRNTLWRSFAKIPGGGPHEELGEMLMALRSDLMELVRAMLIGMVIAAALLLLAFLLAFGFKDTFDVLGVVAFVFPVFGLIIFLILVFGRSVFVFFYEKGLVVRQYSFPKRNKSETIYYYADIAVIEAWSYVYFRDNPFALFSEPIITDWDYHLIFKNNETFILKHGGGIMFGVMMEFWLISLLNSHKRKTIQAQP